MLRLPLHGRSLERGSLELQVFGGGLAWACARRSKGDAMATRSFRVMLTNKTGFPLTKLEDDLDHGEWTEPWFPPDTIAPDQTLGWQSESGGDVPILGSIATGTEGHIKYRIEGGHGDVFYLHWSAPFIGITSADGTLTETFNGRESDDFMFYNTASWVAPSPIYINSPKESPLVQFLVSREHGIANITVGPKPKVNQPLTASRVRLASQAHSGSFAQSTHGHRGNFEMIVAEGNHLVHYWRDNDAAGVPWHRGAELAMPAGASSGRLATIPRVPRGASIIQSNFGDPGNFEVIARISPVIDTNSEESLLVFYSFDSATSQWNGPFPVVADGQPVTGVTADPALIQSSFGSQGNFEMLVPQGGRLVHYWRDNDAPGLPWHRGSELPNPSAGSAGHVTLLPSSPAGTALIQSNFGSPGNLEVIARISRALVSGEGDDYLAFYFFDSAARQWNGPFPLVVDGTPVTGVTGDPALIQSTYGNQGNFELVVLQGEQLMHYWRDNDAPGYPWHKGAAIPAPQVGSGLGSLMTLSYRPVDVAIIQSALDASRNLEVVARMVPITDGTGGAGYLAFYYFDGADSQWHGPVPLSADGRPITGVTGF